VKCPYVDGVKRGNNMRFLTFFNTEHTHLYKDVGMIPFYLARTLGWKCSICYFDNVSIKDSYYEKFVCLLPVRFSKYKFIQYIYIIQFIYRNAKEYDIVNFYHGNLRVYLCALLFKIFNHNCKIYVKMDLNQTNLERICLISIKQSIKHLFEQVVDCFSVETKSFYEHLQKYQSYKNKLIYIPNGFFGNDQFSIHKIIKENIILTVGRIGSYEKNNELLIEAIVKIPPSKLVGWKFFFVGPVTNEFLEYIDQICIENNYLKQHLIFTGNIVDKKTLYEIYSKAKVFCLTSRWESFGIVIPEAMYFHNYIITSDFPAAYDLTDNGYVGKIFESENVYALRLALEEVIDGQVDLEDKGKKARMLVEKFFNWEVIVRKLAERLEAL